MLSKKTRCVLYTNSLGKHVLKRLSPVSFMVILFGVLFAKGQAIYFVNKCPESVACLNFQESS